MLKYDVVIIGAGLAGCAAAVTAAEKGVSVLVVEKEAVIGQPVRCAEYIPKMAVMRWEPRPHVLAGPVQTLRSILPSGENRCMASPGYIINKDVFNRDLALKALAAGAEIMVNTRAVGLDNGGMLLRREQTGLLVKAKVLIGADGPLSAAGKWIGSRNKKFLTGIQYIYMDRCPGEKDMEVFFHHDYRRGYAWLFPKGAGKECAVVHAGVGADTRSGADIREAFAAFREILVRRGRIHRNGELAYTSGLIPVGGILPRLRKDNILLAGDAAGLTDPISGGGNYPALVSGKYAGDAAAEAVLKNDLSLLEDYPARIRDLFGEASARALKKRQILEKEWDHTDLNQLIPRTWVGFKEYYVD